MYRIAILLICSLSVTLRSTGVYGASPLHLSLAQCLSRVLEHNRTLASVRQQIDRTTLNLQSAQSQFDLKVEPQGNLFFSGGKESDDDSNVGVGVTLSNQLTVGTQLAVTPRINSSGSADNDYRSSVRATFDQPLLQGLGKEVNLAEVEGAAYRVRSAKRQYYLSQVDTSLATVRTVYRIIQTSKRVAIEKKSVERVSKVATSAKVKREIGLGSPENVFRAEERLKQNQTELLASEKSEQQLFDNLRTLLNYDQSRALTVHAPDVHLQPVSDSSRAIAIALANRVELHQSQDSLQERYRSSRVAQHNLLPKLNFQISYIQADGDDNLDTSWPFEDDGQWLVGFTASSDLHRTVEKNSYQQSLLAIEDARRELQLVRDGIVKEVKRALRSLTEARQAALLQEKRSQAARQQMALSKLKFKHGMADNFDLLEAEQVLKNAQIKQLVAKTDYILASYSLQQAMGILFHNTIARPSLEVK